MGTTKTPYWKEGNNMEKPEKTTTNNNAVDSSDSSSSSVSSESSSNENTCWDVRENRVPSVVGFMELNLPAAPANGSNSDQTRKSFDKRPRLSTVVLDPAKDYARMISRASTVSAGGPQTEWASIWIAAIILFLCSMQFSVYMASLWPYLNEIDPTANQTFYGFVLAAYSAAQMVASPIMGHLYNRIKRARPVIAAGILFSIAGNLVYMFTEASSSNRKWILMAARFLMGLGGANGGTIRAYISMSSTTEQRARAIAIGTAALSLGATAGPVIQTCVTPIGHPGWVVGPFHISQYTAAAYVSVVGCAFMLALLFTKFTENCIALDEGKKKNAFRVVPKYDKLAAMLCIFCWFSVFFCRTNSDSVESPYTMAVFSWSNDQAVYYNSIIMASASVLSFIIYILMAIYGSKVNERAAVVLGLCMLCGFYALTFPWPFFTGKMNFKYDPHSITTLPPTTAMNTSNVTTNVVPSEPVGCDPEMEWCHYTPRLPLVVYLSSYPMLAAGLPICNVAISTLFSKIIGPRQQGFMQSLMVMAGACARLVGPILITWLFSIFGPRIAWTVTTAVISICITFVIIKFNRLVPLNMKPKLSSGQKLRYDGGSLYRF